MQGPWLTEVNGRLMNAVLQASFDPPGISVSVKKDRAMESLMAPGNSFNINVLAQGRESAAVKAMLKPFQPGEDRFAGMNTEVAFIPVMTHHPAK